MAAVGPQFYKKMPKCPLVRNFSVLVTFPRKAEASPKHVKVRRQNTLSFKMKSKATIQTLMSVFHQREAPCCHRVLPAWVLPVGTQRCQGNRLPPADCARPQQVPPDVLWESRAELRLSLQSERVDFGQSGRNLCGSPWLTPDRFCCMRPGCDPGVRPHWKRVRGIVEQRVCELVPPPEPWGHHQLEPLPR